MPECIKKNGSMSLQCLWDYPYGGCDGIDVSEIFLIRYEVGHYSRQKKSATIKCDVYIEFSKKIRSD